MTASVVNYQGIKERMLIKSSDTSLDVSAQSSYSEAEDYVTSAIQRYDPDFTEVQIDGTPVLVLQELSTDLGAGIFKRRYMPEAMDTGWWAQGLKKLEDYIRTIYLPVQAGTFWFSGMDDVAAGIVVLPPYPFQPDGFGGWLWHSVNGGF
jgi:hypothetical protein